MSLKRLIGAAIGSVLGIFGANLLALVIRSSIAPGPIQSFLQIMVMMVMAYIGLVVGANKGDMLNLAALGGVFGGDRLSGAGGPLCPQVLPRVELARVERTGHPLQTAGRLDRLTRDQVGPGARMTSSARARGDSPGRP